MSIRISNDSLSVLVCGFAIARWADEKALQEAQKKEQPVPDGERENVIVWLDIAPNHPKVLNAIWASNVPEPWYTTSNCTPLWRVLNNSTSSSTGFWTPAAQ